MNLYQNAYNMALPVLRAVSRLAAPWQPKVSDGLAGRRESWHKIGSFLGSRQDTQATGGILIHATSVGEYLQAAPLMQRLKAADSSLPLYLSIFSPSVEKRAMSCPHADLAAYMPEDTRANMRRLLDSLLPPADNRLQVRYLAQPCLGSRPKEHTGCDHRWYTLARQRPAAGTFSQLPSKLLQPSGACLRNQPRGRG